MLREFETWRLIEDNEGVKGWVHQSNLTGRRSFMVADERTLRATFVAAAKEAVAQVGPQTQPQVLGNRQVPHQVQLLVDEGDPEGLGLGHALGARRADQVQTRHPLVLGDPHVDPLRGEVPDDLGGPGADITGPLVDLS